MTSSWNYTNSLSRGHFFYRELTKDTPLHGMRALWAILFLFVLWTTFCTIYTIALLKNVIYQMSKLACDKVGLIEFVIVILAFRCEGWISRLSVCQLYLETYWTWILISPHQRHHIRLIYRHVFSKTCIHSYKSLPSIIDLIRYYDRSRCIMHIPLWRPTWHKYVMYDATACTFMSICLHLDINGKYDVARINFQSEVARDLSISKPYTLTWFSSIIMYLAIGLLYWTECARQTKCKYKSEIIPPDVELMGMIWAFYGGLCL